MEDMEPPPSALDSLAARMNSWEKKLRGRWVRGKQGPAAGQ